MDRGRKKTRYPHNKKGRALSEEYRQRGYRKKKQTAPVDDKYWHRGSYLRGEQLWKDTPYVWSKDENDLLRDEVERLGAGRSSAHPRIWARVAENLPGRTASQCHQHWLQIQKATSDEDIDSQFKKMDYTACVSSKRPYLLHLFPIL